MQLKTKQFQELTATILTAVDNEAAHLELVTKGAELRLNITNKVYYVSAKFPLETPEVFRAVVDAAPFLNLISKITTDTFNLSIKDNYVLIKHGKSSYKAPMIFENESLVSLTPIIINNSLVDMPISCEILKSILNVNGREVQKGKFIEVKELQKLYYIDETGCFTFTTGACLNSFTLEKPVKLLLTDQLVRLFRLFKEDVYFNYGKDPLADGSLQTKVSFETSDIYLASILNCDDKLLADVQRPCAATKSYVTAAYPNHLVLSVSELSNAIARLTSFTKDKLQDIHSIPAKVTFDSAEMTITDQLENSEVVSIENGSYTDATEQYSMLLNLADIKGILETCKVDHITLNCGNHKSIVINRGTINNLVPELTEAE